MAPGTRDTLQELKDETKRPPLPRGPLPPEILNCSPRVSFSLDSGKFLKNVRSAKRGAAGGGIRDDSGTPPSSVRFGQRPTVVLQSGRARADVPPSIVEAIRMGRMTVL